MSPPFFSIIIPTYNRPQALAACIEAIRQLDYPKDFFEVIIVDDGSPNPLKASDFKSDDGIATSILRQNNRGPASARNLGASQAYGDILAFTDDDCTPASRWLSELAQAFHHAPTSLVGGRTINALDNNPYSTASQIIVDEAYAYFLSREDDLRFFSSNNIALPAHLFLEIGGFNASLRTSEDRDFCDRWIQEKHPLVYAPKALVYHRHHLTMTKFCRQHFQYGRGAYRFHQLRARRGRHKIKPDYRFYLSVLHRSTGSPRKWHPLRMVMLIGLWQASNLAGFLWQAAQPTTQAIASTPHKRIGHVESNQRTIQDSPDSQE
jgi:glycosyltransferase involved in cell wall biosynthesis